jgi:adenosylcobinamide-GDP ribazoletransferase
MSSFLLAFQFLTILPLKVKDFSEKNMAWALVCFPIVGFCLGLILFGLNTFLSTPGISTALLNIILVIVLIIITGGMHLDGIADTADAFLSGKTIKEMLEIMRDSHIGVMGVLALISIILLKIGLLSSVNSALKPVVLILMCILSRWSVVLVMYLFPYARQEGKAKLFIQGLNLKIFMSSTILTAIFSFLIWHVAGLIVLLAVALWVYIIGKLASRKIGGVTGDILGAAIELTEIFILFIVCISQGSNLWIN